MNRLVAVPVVLALLGLVVIVAACVPASAPAPAAETPSDTITNIIIV